MCKYDVEGRIDVKDTAKEEVERRVEVGVKEDRPRSSRGMERDREKKTNRVGDLRLQSADKIKAIIITRLSITLSIQHFYLFHGL